MGILDIFNKTKPLKGVDRVDEVIKKTPPTFDIEKALKKRRGRDIKTEFSKIAGIVDLNEMTKSYESNLELNPKKQAVYYKKIHELANNKDLERLFNDLLVEQLREVALNAQSWEETLVGRGGFVGIQLVREKIKALAVLHEESLLPPEPKEDDNHNYD